MRAGWHDSDSRPRLNAAVRTRRSFGMLWRETAEGRVASPGGTHVARAARAVGVSMPLRARRILDAGCGPGADLVALSELHPQATVVGLDFNDAIDVPAQAVASFPHSHVVRGSVLQPPFRCATFDLVYSYGVLHHTDNPARALAALAQLVAPGGKLLIYVYTDLREEPLLRLLLRVVTSVRGMTTRLPPSAVLMLARLLAPVVYVFFGVPAGLLRRVHRGRRHADRIPFNFVDNPTAAVGDLFDRFSAPIEYRHNKAEIEGWFSRAGFGDVVVSAMPDARGWVATGSPSRPPFTA
jgi:SAM-dependent methyltransferase